MPFGAHVLALLETALAECFQYHGELDIFLERSGVGATTLAAARKRAEDRNKMSGRFPKPPKRLVVQELLRDLNSGTAVYDRVVAALVTALCKGSFPNASQQGLSAVEGLTDCQAVERREAAEVRAEQEHQKGAAEQHRDRTAEAKATKRRELREAFLTLHGEQRQQQRGYALERFLNDFFEFEGLRPRSSFKIIGEQIDGSFAWGAAIHLVEAKWVKDPIAGGEFGTFAYKIAGKTADTRGLYVSINGYSPQAVIGLNGKGELRFICVDGAHLLRSLEQGRDFKRVLEILWRHAGETGEAYLPVSSAAFLNRGG